MKCVDTAELHGSSSVVTVAFGLIDLYRSQGRYEEAEGLCLKMLETRVESVTTESRDRFRICLADLHNAMEV